MFLCSDLSRRNLKGDLEEGAWNKGERKASSEGCTTSNFQGAEDQSPNGEGVASLLPGNRIQLHDWQGERRDGGSNPPWPGPFFCVYKSGWIKEKNHQ